MDVLIVKNQIAEWKGQSYPILKVEIQDGEYCLLFLDNSGGEMVICLAANQTKVNEVVQTSVQMLAESLKQ